MASKSGKRASKASKSALQVHEEDHIDGCDFEFHESEATPDSELPMARGGVAVKAGKGARRPRT